MKRWKRFLILVLVPPALAAVLLFTALVVSELITGRWTWRWGLVESLLSHLGLYIIFAYLIAGAPALIYAAVLEGHFSRGLRPSSWRAVFLSGGFGLLTGLGIVGMLLLISRPRPTEFSEWWIFGAFGALGLLVGLIVGALVRWRERVASCPHDESRSAE